jgi:tryptophan-rich sensory protein
LDRTVEGYLAELRRHLAGADPALVQDAVYDADEYLRSALAEAQGDPEAFDAAIEAYGAPDEVAAAYRDSERTVSAALRGPAPVTRRSDNPFARFFGVIADPQAWGALFYLLLALVTGIMYFTIVVTGVSLTLGTLVLIIGVPMALLTIAVVRAISLAEGRIVEGLLGVRMPRRPRTVAGAQGSVWDRIKSWLTDGRTWTTMLYMVLQLPLGIAYFTVLVTAIATSAAVIALPFAQSVADGPLIRTGVYGFYIEPWSYPLLVAVGVLGFFLTLWVAKGIGFLHGQWAKVMLVGRIGAEGGES